MPSFDEPVDDERLESEQDLARRRPVEAVEYDGERLDDQPIDDARLGDVRVRPTELAHRGGLAGETFFPRQPGRRVEKESFTVRTDGVLRF